MDRSNAGQIEKFIAVAKAHGADEFGGGTFLRTFKAIAKPKAKS